MSRFTVAEPIKKKPVITVKTDGRGVVRVMVVMVGVNRSGIKPGNITRTFHLADATVSEVGDAVQVALLG